MDCTFYSSQHFTPPPSHNGATASKSNRGPTSQPPPQSMRGRKVSNNSSRFIAGINGALTVSIVVIQTCAYYIIMGKLLTIGQAAKFLGVSTQTLRRWEREKKLIPSQRTPGGQRRYESSQ